LTLAENKHYAELLLHVIGANV